MNKEPGAKKFPERSIDLGTEIFCRAWTYQRFDNDTQRDVPAEGQNGWQQCNVEFDAYNTALVVMHAWDTGTSGQYPGWHREVEYLPRAQKILAEIFPPLLSAVRKTGIRVFHVVGGGNYYQHLAGFKETVKLAGDVAVFPRLPGTATHSDLVRYHREITTGNHNQSDIEAGFSSIGFAKEAQPIEGEWIAENGFQLAALCRDQGVGHLVYVGFALDWCLLMSPGGMVDMSRYGAICSTIREAVTAVENKETARPESAKELALWRVAVAFGFVFDLNDFLKTLALVREGKNAPSFT